MASIHLRSTSCAALSALTFLSASVSPTEAVLLVGNSALSENGGYNVLSFDEITGDYLGEFIPTGSGGLVSPDDLTFGPDSNLYVSSGNDLATSGIVEPSAILRFDGSTGEFIDLFATSESLNRPYGNAFGPDGNLYVSSFLSDQILRFDGFTGNFIDVFASGNQLPGGLNGPNDLLFTADGDLLVTTQGSIAQNGQAIFTGLPSQILEFDIATGESIVFADQPAPSPDSLGFVSFLGLALGPNGDLYTSDFANGIRIYNLDTGELLDSLPTNYTETSPSNNFIGNLAFGPEDTLYVAGFDFSQDSLGSILRYDSVTGEPLPSAGNFGPIFVPTNSGLIRPIGITVSPTSTTVPESTLRLGLLSVSAGAILLCQRDRKMGWG